MEGALYTAFHARKQPDPDDLIDVTLAVCSEHGLAESASGTPIDPDEVHPDENGRLQLFAGDQTIKLSTNVDRWEPPVDSVLSVRTAATLFRDLSEGPEEYAGAVCDFVDLVCDLAVALDSAYVGTFNTKHGGGGTPSPETVLLLDGLDDLERIPWLGIYSEPLIEELGGRERVLDTPAWRVEELENGSILIITTKVPWDGYAEELPADQYLLHGEEHDDAVEEAGPPDYSDPFAALAPGEYGTALGVHPDDVAEEFPNEDLRLERVYVTDDGSLRRVADDAFVRHVVEESGTDPALLKRMLADVPPTASDDALLASALFHEAIPPEFVRLEHPDGETVVSQVLALDTDVSKYRILLKLGHTVSAEGATEQNVETVRSALDTLSGLEDVEGIDDWLDDFF